MSGTPVDDVTACMDPDFNWPSMLEPGFPALLKNCFASFTVGIDLALSFLPPDVEDLPELPTIDMFILPMPNLPKIPSCPISVPGFPEFTLPSVGSFDIPAPEKPKDNVTPFPVLQPLPTFSWFSLPAPNPSWGPDLSGTMQLVVGFILLPFKVMTAIFESIISLNLKIPGAPQLLGWIEDIFGSLGMPKVSIDVFSKCLVAAISDMLSVIG